MFELILENEAGDRLEFTMNSPFTVTDIQGLNPPSATINTSQLALMDGGKFNSSKVNMRNLNIAFAIEYEAARNRIEVFKVLKSKQSVTMYYKSEYRDVMIQGYITNIDITYFDMKQIVTCAILCPSPFFREAQKVVDELSVIVAGFHFPFASTEEPELVFGYYNPEVSVTVDNDGDVETGLEIILTASDSVSDPTIYNYETGEFIGLDIDLSAGDQVTIDTRPGKKTAYLVSGGTRTNVFNTVIQNSTWLQLPANGGTFVYEVGTGNAADLKVTFKHTNMYEGV